MREILFRGKCFHTEEWVEGYLGIEVPDELVIQQFSYDEYFKSNCIDQYSVKPETIGQYTGLTDKNGTKIFEGDIIRHYYKNLAKNGYTSDEGVVKWDCKECFFYRTSLSGEDKTISVDCIYKVIGNIYDNPELLKGDAENE